MAEMTEAQQISSFSHKSTKKATKPKGTQKLGRTDLLGVSVQLVQREGGETNLHAHTAFDAVWFVLAGRARFYGFGDELIADIGIHEGVIIPRGVPYWFESSADEALEIMHVTARDKDVMKERVNYAPARERQLARGFQHGRPPTDEEIQAVVQSTSGRRALRACSEIT